MLGIFLQYGPGYWFDFRAMLYQWESVGLFDIILPFLLIFAIIYAIFERSKILGENRGVHAIIALVIGFFAIRFDYMGLYLTRLFENTAVGLILLLVVILFLGFFVFKPEKERWWKYIGGIAAIFIFFWVLSRTFQWWGYDRNIFAWVAYSPFWSSIVTLGILIGIVVLLSTILSPGRREGFEVTPTGS